MRQNKLISIVLMLLGLAAPMVGAQGVLIVRPPRDPIGPLPRPWPPLPPPDFHVRPLEIRSIQFEATIRNQAAKTRVTQVFFNPSPFTLEGTFLFPLADEASVSDLIIYEGDKKLRGVVMDQEQARRTYESILREMRDPGLLQYAGKNLLEVRIFPIPAHGEKKIELEYTQVLRADAGLVRYFYPLGAGVRGESAAGPSVAGRISIQSAVPLKSIYSPTHTLSVTRQGESRAMVGWESGHAKPSQDFLLYYLLSDKEFGLSLLTYKEADENGYFMMLLSPKVGVSPGEISSKDIVFVLDVSGSMNDKGKLEKAREALRYGIRSLQSGDRFNLVSFSTEETSFSPEMLAASPSNREKADRFIRDLKAGGGTNIYDALSTALHLFPVVADRPQYLVFLTDGLPTVGETAIEAILQKVRAENRGQVRLFTFGVGYDVNTFLLDQLADGHHGAPDYVAPDEDLEVKVSSFFDKVNYPVLSDIRLEIPGLAISEVYPHQLPDLFKGSQVSILGRYRGEGRATINLSGQFQNQKRRFPYDSQIFPKEAVEADFLPRLWASRKVGYLLDQIRLHGETTELKDEVIHLAKKYGFVTPYTSYLAAEDRDYRRIDRRPVFVRQGRPGSGPGGVAGVVSDNASRQLEARKEAALASPQPAGQSGEGAVWTSQALQGMKASERITSTEKVKVTGDKTFYWKDSAWIDSEMEQGKVLPRLRLLFGSEEYFALLRNMPALARYFVLGENITVIYSGKIYEIRKD